MKRLAAVVTALLAVVPGRARPQDPGAVEETGLTAAPAEAAAPTEAPPAPPATVPAPPAQPQAAAPPATTTGQWVYTDQYGWVWMPYGDAYSYVPLDGSGEPYEYVYYPAYGWCWIGAPWIWGFGPWPYFGVFGPGRFGWYARGWWRTPGRWAGGWHDRPLPFRGGLASRGLVGTPRPGFVARGGFVGRGGFAGHSGGFAGHSGGSSGHGGGRR